MQWKLKSLVKKYSDYIAASPFQTPWCSSPWEPGRGYRAARRRWRFSFVKGLADSQDLSLNISREMLQHDRQLKLIAKSLERTVKNELKKLLTNEREKYEKFWKAFGLQIKFGI